MPDLYTLPRLVPLWVVVGLCLGGGVHHLFIAIRRDRSPVNLSFAAFCFVVALYGSANIALGESTTLEPARFFLKYQIALAFACGLSLVWFVAFYTQVTPWVVLAFMSVYATGVVIYHWSLPYGLFFTELTGIETLQLEWGGELNIPLVKYASGRTRMGDFNVLMQLLFFIYALTTQYRRGERLSAILLGGCLLIYFGGTIHDVIFAREVLIERPEVVNRLPIQEYAFLSLIILMSFRLSNEVLKTAAIREALIESEENLRITLDSIGDAVISTDARGHISRLNPIAEDLTGWKSSEAKGLPLPEVFRIVNSRTRETVPNPAEKVLETGNMVGLANHTVLIHRDGSERQIADSGAPIRDRSGRVVGVVLVFRDVTRQYNLEDQLRHSQKMEAVGRLAGGIAHDFNNLLQAIHGYTSIALSEIGESGRTRGDLEEVLKTADRASLLVRQLLTFSRRESFQPSSLELNNLISEMTQLLRRVAGVNVTLNLSLSEDVAPVLADRGQIEQVLMNLCVNARDAIKDQGEIDIRTRNVSMDAEFCEENSWAREGNYACITFSDTGSGMQPDLLNRIFEPYFTTKQRGEGTGLGLATVFAIVERHEGLIHVFSTPGEGSSFNIYLPAAPSPSAAEFDTPPPEERSVGSGIILLAEDEEVVRNLTVYSLENAGYTVLAAEDGEVASRIFDRRAREIDLAILDLMMPKMGGRAVYDHIRSSSNELPVIFCSGYSPESLEGVLKEDPLTRLLQKPHPPSQLLKLIRSIRDHVKPA